MRVWGLGSGTSSAAHRMDALSVILALAVLAAWGGISCAGGVYEYALTRNAQTMSSDSPYLTGGYISRAWSDIEPQMGEYDWSGIDAQLRDLQSRRKRAALRVFTSGTYTWRDVWSQSHTPHWVFAAGARKVGEGTAYMLLGKTNVTHDQANQNTIPDLQQVENSHAGWTRACTILGWEARRTDIRHGQRYIYFKLDDGLFYDINYPVLVTVCYFDTGYANYHLEYESGEAQDMIQNGDLEVGNDGFADQWKVWAGAGNQTTFTWDTSKSVSPTHSIRARCTSGEGINTIFQTGAYLHFEKDRQYDATLWLVADAPRQVPVRIRRSSDNAVVYDTILDATTQWKQFTFSFTSPIDSEESKVVIIQNGVGTLWLDSVTCKVGGGPALYRSAGNVQKQNTGKWRIAKWHLTDAKFANGQPGGSDFRIASSATEDVHIRYVDVHRDDTTVMPVYWDPIYIEKYGELIDALGKRYGSSPHIEYVLASFGKWGETTLDASGRFEYEGYTFQKYYDYMKYVTERYQAAFPRARVAAALGGVSDSGGGHHENMYEIPEYFVSRGIQLEHTGGRQDPHPNGIRWYDEQGCDSPGTLAYLFHAYYQQVPIGVEMGAALVDPDTIWRGLMHMATFHFDSVRVYTEDIQANPAAVQFLAEHLGKRIDTTKDVWIGLRKGLCGNYEYWLKQDDTVADGRTAVSNGYDPNTFILGKEWRRTDNANGRRYIYLNVDNGFIFGGSSEVVIRVVYLDQGSGQFRIQYDSAGGGAYVSTDTVQRTGTGQWKTVDFEIPDAGFCGGQANGCDFRLDSMGTDLYVHFIQVIKKKTAFSRGAEWRDTGHD
jgi:hypothetical protein